MRSMLAADSIGFRPVRLALMIEGQEGVTWDDWVALASACEEHGVEALFRSDHYISWFDESRHVLDAWATLAGRAPARRGSSSERSSRRRLSAIPQCSL